VLRLAIVSCYVMSRQSDVATFVHAHYDIEVRQFSQLTDKVFRVQTQQKDYLLKLAAGDDEFLMNQLYGHKEMPEIVLPIYETKSGARMATEGRNFAYLTDYVEQVPMPFESRVRDYAGLLNTLHEKTEIVVDKNDDEVSWLYEEDYRRLEACFMMLEQMQQHYEMKISRSPFEWQVVMMYPLLYGMYRRSDDAMKRFYQLLGRKKRLPIALTHGDVNVANVLPGTKRTHLINFENSSFDLPSQDMVKFLAHYHSSRGTTKIIADYLKLQKDQLVVHHFFMRSLCVDLTQLSKALTGNALIDISLLNEKLAPGLIAMGIYDEMNQPKQKPKARPQTSEQTSEAGD